jgi:GDSL-like Lipase/Acylhydrolase family
LSIAPRGRTKFIGFEDFNTTRHERGNMKRTGLAVKFAVTLAALLFLSVVVSAQVINYQPKVSLLGDSIALFEAGLQPEIFPTLIRSNVYIFGHNGYTCNLVSLVITYDAFGTTAAPRNPDIIVLVNDTTNDVEQGTTPASLLTCLQNTVSELLARKSNLKIVVLTTPPWTQYNPCLGVNNNPSIPGLIASYNALMPELQTQWPHNVRVLDANTPFLDGLGDGWANPALMTGPCGIHPGPQSQWSGGQPTLAAVFRNTVLTSNQPW